MKENVKRLTLQTINLASTQPSLDTTTSSAEPEGGDRAWITGKGEARKWLEEMEEVKVKKVVKKSKVKGVKAKVSKGKKAGLRGRK